MKGPEAEVLNETNEDKEGRGGTWTSVTLRMNFFASATLKSEVSCNKKFLKAIIRYKSPLLSFSFSFWRQGFTL